MSIPFPGIPSFSESSTKTRRVNCDLFLIDLLRILPFSAILSNCYRHGTPGFHGFFMGTGGRKTDFWFSIAPGYCVSCETIEDACIASVHYLITNHYNIRKCNNCGRYSVAYLRSSGTGCAVMQRNWHSFFPLPPYGGKLYNTLGDNFTSSRALFYILPL